jgi:hypothetical protein
MHGTVKKPRHKVPSAATRSMGAPIELPWRSRFTCWRTGLRRASVAYRGFGR